MLSPRLKSVLKYIQGDVLADIGTDHGYLPIEAVKSGICKKVVACDVRPGPLQACKKNVNLAGLSKNIEIRLGDGLKPIEKVDTIVISGMGGMLIWNIISRDIEKAKVASRLVLQPQHDHEQLRRNLHKNGFEISHEELIKEGTRFYIILVTSYTGEITEWTDKEYFLGKLIKETSVKQMYLAMQKEKISRYIHSISHKQAKQTALSQIEWISQTLDKLP